MKASTKHVGQFYNQAKRTQFAVGYRAPRLMISVEQFHGLQRVWVFLPQVFWTSRLQVGYCLNFPLLGFVWPEKPVLTVILQKYTSQNWNLFLLPSYTCAKGLAECLGQCLTWSLHTALTWNEFQRERNCLCWVHAGVLKQKVEWF